MNPLGIQFENVDVTFRLRTPDFYRLRNSARRLYQKTEEPRIEALRGISVSIAEGERVAVVGRNGSGKSTFLRAAAGIYRPSRGYVRVLGRVCPVFDLGTGFDGDSSGWENIRLRCLLLGADGRELERRSEEIAEFTELGRFLDYPVRTYSAGMAVRLSFASLLVLRPEILLLDEVFGTGDAVFVQKASREMSNLISRGGIVVMSGHNLPQLEELCDRALWLDEGIVRMDGPASEVIAHYLEESGVHLKPHAAASVG